MGGYVYRGAEQEGWPDLIELNRVILAERPDQHTPRYRRGEAPCGTRAAYRRHQRHGERPCEACRGAENAAAREKR